ncbi:MAG: glycosyltransferase [Planctomycetota bacterium]|nr:glycosyltransferase [Planctomycetota bacterium]
MALENLLYGAHAATLGLLGLFGVHRVWLLTRFSWETEDASRDGEPADESWPKLTVQLPVYNERTVAARLIRAAGALDYPRGRLDIQVLDDSNDETCAIVDEEVRQLVASGIQATVIRRTDRTGFKAGALANGMKSAHGDLICIFDADFTPERDFLLRLVPRFADPKVGMVQARWGHLNRDESRLTRAESTLLDGHFVIEHKVRHDSGVFFNFNGTAGIWRREAIDSAGGWQHDTLTEDLDLSYRAQLRGWKFEYVPLVVAPAEVPSDIAAFKSQQHRWAKGSVQVFKKLAVPILSSQEPLKTKLEAMAHLTGNVGYPFVLFLSLLLPLSLGFRNEFSGWVHVALFLVCTLTVLAFYEASQRVLGRTIGQRLVDTACAVSLGIGMSVSQTRAVIEGLLPGTGVFVRTPKKGSGPKRKRYANVMRGMPGVELLFAAWIGWGIFEAATNEMWGSLPFLLLFFVGFAWVGTLSAADALRPLFASAEPAPTPEVTSSAS